MYWVVAGRYDMVLPALIIGLVVAPVAGVVVYLDGIRRSLSGRARLSWAGVVGLVSLAGFAIPYLFAGPLHRSYLQLVHRQAVVVTPYAIRFRQLFVGGLVTALALLGYGLVQQPGIAMFE